MHRTSDYTSAKGEIDKLLRLFARLGVPIATQKTITAVTSAEYCGVVFDSVAHTVAITSKKRAKYDTLLRSWLKRTTATIKECQQLAGSLNWLAAILPQAAALMPAVYTLPLHGPAHHHVRIHQDIRDAVGSWFMILTTWSGTRLLTHPEKVVGCYVDACTAHGGGGFVASGRWFYVP